MEIRSMRTSVRIQRAGRGPLDQLGSHSRIVINECSILGRASMRILYKELMRVRCGLRWTGITLWGLYWASASTTLARRRGRVGLS